MKGWTDEIDDIPVTLVIAVAYAGLAVLTHAYEMRADSRELYDYGWLVPGLAVLQPWRLLSSAFLHGGVIHLLFNMSMLFAIGPSLERTLGSLRYAALYVIAALGGSIAVCLCYEVFQPVIGGSGALFGMLGAAAAVNMRSGRHLLAFLDFEGPRRLLGMIVGNLAIGFFLPFISNTAHIGGLLAGFLVTLLWLDPARESSRAVRHWRVACTALFAGLLFASIVPVTRDDWLCRAAQESPPSRQRAFERAWARSLGMDPDRLDHLDAEAKAALHDLDEILAPPEKG